MSTPDAKDGNESGTESALGSGPAPAEALPPEKQSADEAAAAWPPKEAAPVDDSPAGAAAQTSANATASPTDTSATPAAEAAAAAKDEAKKTPPAGEQPAGDGAAKPTAATADPGEGVSAALPREEMPFSNSTLHWLEDGEVTGQSRITDTITSPSFDPTAPVAGRRRAIFVVGGAGIVALLIAGALYVQAENRRAAIAPAPAVADPAQDLTARAEAALAANKVGEALDLAHLALVADPRSADAHFVVANCERSRNQLEAARDEYRRYLALAPLGTHAAEARGRLATLPP